MVTSEAVVVVLFLPLRLWVSHLKCSGSSETLDLCPGVSGDDGGEGSMSQDEGPVLERVKRSIKKMTSKKQRDLMFKTADEELNSQKPLIDD